MYYEMFYGVFFMDEEFEDGMYEYCWEDVGC